MVIHIQCAIDSKSCAVRALKTACECRKIHVLSELFALCAEEAIIVYLHMPGSGIGQRCPGTLPKNMPVSCPATRRKTHYSGRGIERTLQGIKRTLPGIGRSDDSLDESGGFSCSCAIVTAAIDTVNKTVKKTTVKRR